MLTTSLNKNQQILLSAVDAQREFSDIPGIVYRKDGQIIENLPREFIEDLDTLCFPHEHANEVLKDYDQYPLPAFQYIFAARGCPYNCFFCGSRKIWSRKVRFRSIESVIGEIKSLQEKGLKSVSFADDTFGVTKQRINDLCDAIAKHCPKLRWSCEMPVKLVDEQTISVMKSAGCYAIRIGVESGNNEILRQINKNITIEEAFAACKLINRHDIELMTFFILGFPHDTEETLNDTIRAMKKIKSNKVILSIYTPYPGTEAFEFCREKGLVDDDYDVSLYNHQSPANCFCGNIDPEKFRTLVRKAAKMVDRKKVLYRAKSIFSPKKTLWKVRQLGIRKSLKKGLSIFRSK